MTRLPCILALALLAGCDDFKKFDEKSSLTFAPGVDTVQRDGTQLIRLRNKTAVVVVDPVGARVLDFHFERAPKYTYDSDPVIVDRVIRREHSFPAEPNVLGNAGWSAVATPGGEGLANNRHWSVDAEKGKLTLLSDEVGELRQRTTFILHPNSVLDVTVEFQNKGPKEIELGGESRLHAAGELKDSGTVEHHYAEKQWFSRLFLTDPPPTPGPLPKGGKITWTERWWITKDSIGKTPPNPPRVAEPRVYNAP